MSVYFGRKSFKRLMWGRRWFEAHRTAGSSQDIGSLSLNSPSLTHSCRFLMGIIIPTAFICRMPSFSAISAGGSLAVVVFNPQKLAPISSFVFFFSCSLSQHQQQLNPVSRFHRLSPKEITFHTCSTQWLRALEKSG